MSLKAEARNLVEEIIGAFADVPHPGPKNITAEGCCAECDEIAAWYGWHTADELLRELRQRPDETYGPTMLFLPAAFHYFLPAYLIHSVEPLDPEADRISSCIYSLFPISDKTRQQDIDLFRVGKMNLFNHRLFEGIGFRSHP